MAPDKDSGEGMMEKTCSSHGGQNVDQEEERLRFPCTCVMGGCNRLLTPFDHLERESERAMVKIRFAYAMSVKRFLN